MKIRIVLAAVVCLVGLGSQAAVWHVDKDNLSAAQDGLSWATAFRTIQPALDAASEGDEVWVAEGVYGEQRLTGKHAGKLDTGSLLLRRDVGLYGGFAGTETDRSQRDWQYHLTAIDGSRSRDGQKALHVVVGAPNALIDGFVITGGNATELPGHENLDNAWGGGVLLLATSMTIANCTISHNAADSGGGVAVYDARVNLENCVISENDALAGGAVGCLQRIPGVVQCRVKGCTITGNTGTALAVNGARTVIVEDSVFIDNVGSRAGAVDIRAIGMLSIGAAQINRCIFSRNRGADASVIRSSNATAEITNCLVADNSGDYTLADGEVSGGGSAMLGSELVMWKIKNSTIVNNLARSGSNGLVATNYELTNCIFWNTIPADHIEPYPQVSPVFDAESQNVVSHCNIQGIAALNAQESFELAPKFVDPDNSDYRLRADSPCRDTGSDQDAPEVDLDGVVRPQESHVDIGAYEFDAAQDVDGDGVPDIVELANLTDPLRADSDDDGYWDGLEVERGTDPRIGASHPVSTVFSDVDLDGVLGATDVQLVINACLGLPVPVNTDLDGSGENDAVDVQLAINALLGIGGL